MQGRKDYQEKLFVSFQLSDRVPAGNRYRRLQEELDLSWVYGATGKYYGSEGQKSVDPVVFFKLLLVGYLENLNSDRKIIEHSSMRLDILYFLGYDIDEELPWHSTLSRTRQLYGQEVFKELFLKVLGLCVSKGMLSGRRQAIDSAYVKANASLDNLVEKEVLEDGELYLQEVKNASQNEDKDSGEGSSLMGDGRGKEYVSRLRKASVERGQRNSAKKYDGMPSVSKEVEEDESRPRFLSNHTHYSATDGDARISVKPGKPRQLNYSMQTSVDIGSHVITHVEAFHADKRDSECLEAVLTATMDNLREHGLLVEEIAADSGYSSGKSLQACDQSNIIAYISNHGSYKNEREGFIYNKEDNSYSCRNGKRLTYRRSFVDDKGYVKDEYKSLVSDCSDCPLRKECLRGKMKFKKIVQTADKELYDQMHERMQSRYGKYMKKKRQSTVEPVLGTLINFTGIKRIWTRGIKQADKFMLGAAIAYNLKKWLNYSRKKRKIAIMKLKELKKERFLMLPFLLASYNQKGKLFKVVR